MKYFLRIFIGLSIIMLGMLVTATSCNKTAGDKSNSGGGGGNGDNTPQPSTPAITINIPDANTNRVKLGPKTATGEDTILINIGGYGGTGTRAVRPAEGLVELATVNESDTLRDLFELKITGGVVGDTPVSAGLVLVNTGDLANITNFSVPAPSGTVTYDSGPYRTVSATEAGNNADYLPAGAKFFGLFADTNLPANTNPSATPFAFTVFDAAFFDSQLVIACRAVVSTITTTTPDPATELTGGQTSKCFGGIRGGSSISENDWSAGITAAATAMRSFKNAFYISVAGIRTDKKALSEVLKGFPQATPAAKVTEFMNKITPAEMKLIADNNIVAYKKILLKLVSSTDFAAAK